MAAHSVLTIRLVGGHPALDLLNTVDLDRQGDDKDVLRSFHDDAGWAVRVGILPTADADRLLTLGERFPRKADQAHAGLLAARESLRMIVRSEVEGTRLNPAAAEQFEQLVAAAAACRRFCVSQVPTGWRWLNDDLDTVQHRVMLAAADLLADQSRRRVSVCAGPDCDWYFLDASKSGNRRWCSDAGCGGASRVRRLRQRQSARC